MIISKHDLECWLKEREYVAEAKVKVDDNCLVVAGITLDLPLGADQAWVDLYMEELQERLDEVKPCGIRIALEVGVGKGPYR